MCWAKAFKGEEEMKCFERGFIMSRPEPPGIDKYHEAPRFVAIRIPDP